MGQSGGREAPQINGKVRNDAEDDAEDRAGCWDPIDTQLPSFTLPPVHKLTYRSSSSRTLYETPPGTPPSSLPNFPSSPLILYDSDRPSSGPSGRGGTGLWFPSSTDPTSPPSVATRQTPYRSQVQQRRGYASRGGMVGLADMLVAELAKARLHDPPSPWRERSNGVIKTNGVAGMSELSGRGKRKREASEEDAMDQDRCVTSTPTREVSEAVDDGYEADVSMTGAELQRLLGDPFASSSSTNDQTGEDCSFERLAVTLSDGGRGKRQRRYLRTPDRPKAHVMYSMHGARYMRDGRRREREHPDAALGEIGTMSATDTAIPTAPFLRAFRPLSHLPVPYVSAPASNGLPYTADDSPVNSKASRGASSMLQPSRLLQSTSSSSSSVSTHKVAYTPIGHQLPMRPLTRYDDIHPTSSHYHPYARRRPTKRPRSPAAPLRRVDDATVIAVCAAVQGSARPVSPMKEMWGRYTREHDHWSPASSPTRAKSMQDRWTRDDHWSPSPSPPTSSRSTASNVFGKEDEARPRRRRRFNAVEDGERSVSRSSGRARH